ncbi:MAG: polysaccharide deacetylase family protein [Planctomycetales bacterium]|nr:polysaccharide deacetylase family protein [Planctomycetales bacterium]
MRHVRRIDWLATFAPRMAAPFFRDVVWRGERFVRGFDDGHTVQPPAKAIYLTFDDGPTREGTPKLLDVLERFGVQATFFLLGQQAERHPELVRAIVAAGHDVGNHTFGHIDAWRTLFPQVAEELVRTQAILEELTQQPIRLVRPPHGHFTAKLRTWCRERSQRLVMWDVMPADFVPWIDADRIVRSITRWSRPGSIVVLHDNPKSLEVTPAALEVLLPKLLDDGWHFGVL